MQRAGRTRLWCGLPPLRIRVHRLAVVLGGILLRRSRRRHFWAQILFPRQSINDRALVLIKLPLRERLDGFHRGVLVARNVRRKKIWCAQIVVVTVQTVGHTSKPSERLQSRDNS